MAESRAQKYGHTSLQAWLKGSNNSGCCPLTISPISLLLTASAQRFRLLLNLSRFSETQSRKLLKISGRGPLSSERCGGRPSVCSRPAAPESNVGILACELDLIIEPLYYPQPYTSHAQLRIQYCLNKGYRELVWASFWVGGCVAGGSIGL